MHPLNSPLFCTIIVCSAQLITIQSVTTNTSSTTNTVICQNNGTISSKNSSICNCLWPWSGISCSEYDCVKGLSVGDQFDENSIFFNKRCICDNGYTGELCDIPLVNPCGAHGNLIDDKCICRANYSGPKCESVEHCLHGQLSSGRCNCLYGWNADFCNEIVCQQGSPDETNSSCICRSGYRGKFCDVCADTSEEMSPFPECAVKSPGSFHMSQRFIIITAALSVIFLAACLIIFRIVWRRNQQNSQGRRYGIGEIDLKKRIRLMKSDDETGNL